MGDRVSIQFVRPGRPQQRSVVLFSHWGGLGLVDEAYEYAEGLAKLVGDNHMKPLDRLEPDTVMVDFILQVGPRVAETGEWKHTAHLQGHIAGNLYLKSTDTEGDNSDNGHWLIPLFRVGDEGFGKRKVEGWQP